MPAYDEEILAAARHLVARRHGARGRLSLARIRRSISTSYYAIFHFLLEEASLRLVGSENDLRRRRRIFARAFTHSGLKTALDKVRGRNVDASVADFLRGPNDAEDEAVSSPAFVQDVANAFRDAQTKRYDADYDLNKNPSEADARLLHTRVSRVIDGWRAAQSPAERDFKHALCMLMVLKGKLRNDD